jgi:hypothetical protein
MDVTILKQIRLDAAIDHKASYENINGHKGWYLLRYDNTICSDCCDTKEQALSSLKTLWHKYAERYLSQHGYGRHNYVW